MNEQDEVSYIQDLLAQGKSQEEIYKDLLEKGLTLDEIQKCLKIIELKDSTGKRKEQLNQQIIRAFVTVGIFFIGIGIALWIIFNWANLSRIMQVLILLVPMLLAELSGWYLKEQKKLTKTGEALIVLGLFLYGVSLFMIPPMLEIHVEVINVLSLLVLTVIFMAFASDTFVLFYPAIVLSIIILILIPPKSHLALSYVLLLIVDIIMFITSLHFRRQLPTLK
ncbi:MAG: DUF2157 domain-containing protein [Candidatus Pacebacteria bacterium]|nr:DUF2157 domain-containing protein [Candidatus Paceibacterota bacterium]